MIVKTYHDNNHIFLPIFKNYTCLDILVNISDFMSVFPSASMGVCTYIHLSHFSSATIPAEVLQNVTGKSCLICGKSRNYVLDHPQTPGVHVVR